MPPTNLFPQNRCRKMSAVMVALLLCVLLAPSLPAKTVVDFDPKIDFSKYKTWTYIGGVEHLVMLQLNPDLITDNVHQALQRELGQRGLREVKANENPDLAVRYWANSSSQLNVAGSVGWGMYAPYLNDHWGFLYNQINVTTSRDGALVIDLLDTHTKALTWRMYVTMKILNPDPEKIWKQADADIAKAFKSYPPSPKEVADMKKEWAKEAEKKQKSTGFMGP
jgi:hypothetical protein